MSEVKMENPKIESKAIGRHKYILINDAGIGSNRLVMTNHYLNNFNIYRKNMIKMSKILEIKNYERKKKLEKFKKDKEVPGLMFSSAYYKYSGNDYEYFENDKNNVNFKKPKINYLQDFLNGRKKNLKLKLNNQRNKNKDEVIYKSLKLSGGLTEEKNSLNKDKIYNYRHKIKKNFDEDYDDFLNYKTINNTTKSKSIQCKIMFGKNIHNDSENYKMNKNRRRNISYNKNSNTNFESSTINDYNKMFWKEDKSKSIKMKLLRKNKLLPLINYS